MTGIFDRIGAMAGTEWAQATNFAHQHFQDRMGEHRHPARALVETVAEVAREHNNLVGLAVGFTVERWLQAEKDRHDAAKAAGAPPGEGWTLVAHDGERMASPPLKTVRPPVDLDLPIFHQSPTKVALEVFGALLLLKMAAGGARFFRRDKTREVWFAPAGRIRLFSGALATYFLVKALKAKNISAWRNAAILLFGTDAIKPVLRAPRRRKTR
jgi:hypothetical protein